MFRKLLIIEHFIKDPVSNCYWYLNIYKSGAFYWYLTKNVEQLLGTMLGTMVMSNRMPLNEIDRNISPDLSWTAVEMVRLYILAHETYAHKWNNGAVHNFLYRILTI